MSALARFVTGRRTKWLVVGLWIVAVVALSPLGAKLADATSDETASFLPEGAEATKVQELLKERFPGGETSIGLIVYRREGGLTAADKARIAERREAVDAAIPVTRRRRCRSAPSPAGPRLATTATPPTRSSPCRSTSSRSPTGARRRAR